MSTINKIIRKLEQLKQEELAKYTEITTVVEQKGYKSRRKIKK